MKQPRDYYDERPHRTHESEGDAKFLAALFVCLIAGSALGYLLASL